MDFICALRLSDATMRHRRYKTEHIAASLRPSVAAAMGWLTEPQADDVFLDPMCGAGTLLIERGVIARHRLLLGVDHGAEVLAAASANIGPRHKPRQLFRADARRLPLRSGSVTKIATNLPFGKRVGTHRDNVPLYREAIREMHRVLAPGGRMVLGSERDPWRRRCGRWTGCASCGGTACRSWGCRRASLSSPRPKRLEET